MNTYKHPIGGMLTRDYFRGMVDKTWRVEPPCAIVEIRMPTCLALQVARLEVKEAGLAVDPKHWKILEDYYCVFDINHPKNLVTLTREDGLQVSFPVEC